MRTAWKASVVLVDADAVATASWVQPSPVAGPSTQDAVELALELLLPKLV